MKVVYQTEPTKLAQSLINKSIAIELKLDALGEVISKTHRL